MSMDKEHGYDGDGGGDENGVLVSKIAFKWPTQCIGLEELKHPESLNIQTQ